MVLRDKDCGELREIVGGKGLGWSYADLTRLLERADFHEPNAKGGSHRVWVRKASKTVLTIKSDGKRDLLPCYVKDTAKAILALGLCD